MKKQLLIYTDLDGTLLELSTYSFQPAVEALRRVQAHAIPLIFCSSKTRSEQRYYQQKMGICAPMIVENGAAIVIPAGYFSPRLSSAENDEVIELGVPVSFIRDALQCIREELHLTFSGYAELSLEELCYWTGLKAEAAQRAQQREYSETLIGELTTDEVMRLNAALHNFNLAATKGSRFYTVSSVYSDKGMATAGLTELFQQKFGQLMTIGLGDGANDLSMLRMVDRAFLLSPPSMPDNTDGSGATGPAAWAAIINRLLDELTERHSYEGASR